MRLFLHTAKVHTQIAEAYLGSRLSSPIPGGSSSEAASMKPFKEVAVAAVNW